MQYNKSAYTVKMKPMLLFKWLDKLQTSYLTQLLVQLGFAAIIRWMFPTYKHENLLHTNIEQLGYIKE